MKIRALLRDERGSAIAMFAVFLMAGVGFAAIAIDGGYLYSLKNKLQTTADAAVLVAVSELPDTDVARTAAIVMAGKNMAPGEHGAVLASADVVTGNWDTGTRMFTAGGTPLDAVRVVTRRSQANGNAAGLFFARILGFNQVDVETTAIAMLRSGDGCVVALDPSADNALSVNGNAVVTMDCAVYVNSTGAAGLVHTGKACLTAAAIMVVGDYTGSCLYPTPNTGMASMTDPLKDLKPPSDIDVCDHDGLVEVLTDTTLSPGVYCGGIFISSDASVIFNPGIYVVDGIGLRIFGNSTVTGDEVAFYFPPTMPGVIEKGGKNPPPQSIKIAGTSSVTLSAPTSGDYEAILFYQDRDTPSNFVNLFEGGADMALTGVIYAPNTNVKFAGNTEGSGSAYTSIMARTVEFTGNSYLGQDITAAGFSIEGFGAGGISLVQ